MWRWWFAGRGFGVCFKEKKRRRKERNFFGVVVSEEVAVRSLKKWPFAKCPCSKREKGANDPRGTGGKRTTPLPGFSYLF
ncbi:uncharacterized [Tachysurus ichikawai]